MFGQEFIYIPTRSRCHCQEFKKALHCSN